MLSKLRSIPVAAALVNGTVQYLSIAAAWTDTRLLLIPSYIMHALHVTGMQDRLLWGDAICLAHN